MLTFRVTATGMREFADKISLIRGRMGDFVPVWEVVEKVFHKMEEIRFDSEGPGWAPLAASTLAFKDMNNYPSDILIRTGDLQQSLLGYEGSISELTPDTLEVGTSIDYAQYHQKGTSKMPRRPLISISQSATQVFAEMVSAYLAEGTTAEPEVSV